MYGRDRIYRTPVGSAGGPKNVYIDKLHDIVNKYNNHHRTIKIKPADVKSSTFIDFNVENNNKYPEIELGDHGRILKYKNIFAKCYYYPNWCEELFVIKKIKILCHGDMLLVVLTVNKLLERFTKKNCKK